MLTNMTAPINRQYHTTQDKTDRRAMSPLERVQLWMQVHTRAAELHLQGISEINIRKRIAFEMDLSYRMVCRIMKQRLR
jgi:hypothetical protein